MKFCFSKVLIPSGVSPADWFNWKWQIRHSLHNQSDFAKYFKLSVQEKKGFQVPGGFATQSTPYYAFVAKSYPVLKRGIVPRLQEGYEGRQAMSDPLGEETNSPFKHLIHRYPDRVVFLVTDICPIYCRYCTRKRWTATAKKIIPKEEYQKALSYIRKNPGIREVILSGGDPLTLSDVLLERILKDLRSVSHIEIIRIGSRMPAVCPMRWTPDLLNMIKKYHPVFIMSHFNHPAEITKDSAKALTDLADQGIPVYNQMVLINGLNNHPAIVQALSRRLLFLRARPYYMFQCDPSLGSDHLRTSLANSRWIQRSLWGVFSGLAVPRLSVDLPGGGGKVELTPESQVSSNAQQTVFRGWDGIKSAYINPDPKGEQSPLDLSLYLKEWQVLQGQGGGD